MTEHIIFDSEIVASHYLFKAKRISDQRVITLWGGVPEHMERLGALLRNPNLTWVGFNSNDFDIPLALAAAGGRTVPELKVMANDLINNRKPQWMALRDYGLEWPEALKTIDLIEVAPGLMIGLKMYGARMNSPSIMNMPVEHDAFLSQEEAKMLDPYCLNDIEETERLFHKLESRLELRAKLSAIHEIDLMSKSDAQMAETIIAKKLGLLRAGKPEIPKSVRFKAPSFVQPASPILQDILQRTQKHVFMVRQSNGSIILPPFLSDEPVLLGNGVFQMGIGGLHSKHDKSVHYVATPDFEIVDADVGSFYPNILLNAMMIPRGLGAPFIQVYKGFVDDRLYAKHRAAQLEKMESRTPEEEIELEAMITLREGGKIMVNGTFGKLGSSFAKIFAPDLMLGITLSGQFYLLSVIEGLVALGATIISANTDGVTFGGTPEVVKKCKEFIEVYGWTSNFEFEFAHYRSISMKDCNNYIAVKTDGKVKAKGIYAEAGLKKNPTNEVCTIAAQAYLVDGTAIEDTVLKHFTLENFPDFLQARAVNGVGGCVMYDHMMLVDDWEEVAPRMWYRKAWLEQGMKPGEDGARTPVNRKSRPHPVPVGVEPEGIGKVVRWYYSTRDEHKHGLHYAETGNLVPKSTGGRPCMILPKELPSDVDLQRYIDEAIENLSNMGVQYVRTF